MANGLEIIYIITFDTYSIELSYYNTLIVLKYYSYFAVHIEFF